LFCKLKYAGTKRFMHYIIAFKKYQQETESIIFIYLWFKFEPNDQYL